MLSKPSGMTLNIIDVVGIMCYKFANLLTVYFTVQYM